VGGLATSFALELLVYPSIYYLWKRREVVDGPPTEMPSLTLAESPTTG